MPSEKGMHLRDFVDKDFGIKLIRLSFDGWFETAFHGGKGETTIPKEEVIRFNFMAIIFGKAGKPYIKQRPARWDCRYKTQIWYGVELS